MVGVPVRKRVVRPHASHEPAQVAGKPSGVTVRACGLGSEPGLSAASSGGSDTARTTLFLPELAILPAFAWAFYVLGDIAHHAGFAWCAVAFLCLVPVVALLPEVGT